MNNKIETELDLPLDDPKSQTPLDSAGSIQPAAEISLNLFQTAAQLLHESGVPPANDNDSLVNMDDLRWLAKRLQRVEEFKARPRPPLERF